VPASVAQVALVVIAIYPSFQYPAPMVEIQDGDYFDEANLRSHRVLQELTKVEDIPKYRLIVADDHFSTQWWSMNAAFYGLRTFEAFMNPLPYGQMREMNAALALPRFGQLLGAKYYLNCADSSSIPPGYSFDRRIEGCNLYSAADAQSHYFLSTEIALSFSDVDRFLDMMKRDDADLNKVSINSKDLREITDWLGDSTAQFHSETFREERSLNTFNVGLTTNRRSLLVLNEYFRNDWQVTLNGRSQRSFKVNLNQIGVLLPAGTNEVQFQYRPRLFIWLWYVQRAAFAVLAVVIIGMVTSTTIRASKL
jgi:membrane protein YfhO